MYKLANVSNLAAWGVEWAGETGIVHQLVNSRGTMEMTYARKGEDGCWVHTRVVDPYRFGMRDAPKTFKAFREIADRFVNPKAGAWSGEI